MASGHLLDYIARKGRPGVLPLRIMMKVYLNFIYIVIQNYIHNDRLYVKPIMTWYYCQYFQ